MASSSSPSAAPPTLRRALTTVPTTSSLLHGGHLGSAHELHYRRHLTAGTAAAGISPLSIEQVGESHLEYTVRWRVHPWESLEPMTEFRSPTFVIDHLPWSLKVFKGRVHHPGALSLYLGCDGKMTGVHKRVRITFMIENAQNARLPGYSLVEQPVWFSSDHLTWGEENLCLLDQITPLIHADTLALSVHIQIIQTLAESPPLAPSPLCNLFANRAFADAILRVSCDDDDPAVDIPIHRAILASQSTYFATMFYTSQFAESFAHFPSASTWSPDSPRCATVNPVLPTIPIRGTDPGAFMHLVSFMYRQPMHPPSDPADEIHPILYPASTSHLVEELVGTFSLDELSICLATSHMYQVSTWTDLLLCAVRLLVTDLNVWRVWELGEMYECEKTTNKAKLHVSTHFSRICSSLFGKSPTRPASAVGTTATGGGQRSRYSTGLSSSSATATSSGSITSMHASSIPGIQWHHSSSTHLASIPASRMRTLLQMDPVNCDNEEQMFELFSEWVMARFVKSGGYDPAGSRQHSEPSAVPTRCVEPHDITTITSVMSPPPRVVSDMNQALQTVSPTTSRPPPNLTLSPTIRTQRRRQTQPAAASASSATPNASLEDPHDVIADLIRLIRFPVMRKEYLVTTVEGADHLMCWPEVRETLRETYRALLVPDHTDVEVGANWVPRRRVVVGTWPDGGGGDEGRNGCAVI